MNVWMLLMWNRGVSYERRRGWSCLHKKHQANECRRKKPWFPCKRMVQQSALCTKRKTCAQLEAGRRRTKLNVNGETTGRNDNGFDSSRESLSSLMKFGSVMKRKTRQHGLLLHCEQRRSCRKRSSTCEGQCTPWIYWSTRAYVNRDVVRSP